MAYNYSKLAKYYKPKENNSPYDKFSNESLDNMENAYNKYNEEPTAKRGPINRFFDAISLTTYPIMGALKGLIDKDDPYTKENENTNPISGFVNGIRASNPFGKGYEKGRVMFGDVLETAGWQPKSLGGKIAKGAVGLTGDVLLDPLTYMSGGLSALTKGSGKKVGKEVVEEMSRSTAESIAKETFENISKSKLKDGSLTKGALSYIDELNPALEKEIQKVISNYNRVRGINQVQDGIQLSLGNAPFGKQIFGKELASKSIKIADNKKLIEFGDKTLAPWLNKARDSFMGSKLAPLVTNNAVLYKHAKSDPQMFYNLVYWNEIKTGLKGSRLDIAKNIREKMDLMEGATTPAQRKQILDALEDPASMKKIRKYLNTEAGQDMQESIIDRRAEILNDVQKRDELVDITKSEIKDIEKQIKELDKVGDSTDGLYSSIKQREDFIEEITNKRSILDEKIKAPKFKDSKKIERNNVKQVTELQKELDTIKTTNSIDEIESSTKSMNKIQDIELESMHLQSQADELKRMRETEISKLKNEYKELGTKSKSEKMKLSHQNRKMKEITRMESEVNLKRNIIELEKLKNSRDYDKLIDINKAIETDDAYETYVRSVMGDDVYENTLTQLDRKNLLIRDALDENKNLDETVRFYIRDMRADFIKIAEEEIGIGKLKGEAAYKLLMEYVPHEITDDGLDLLRRLELKNGVSKSAFVTEDFGFGQKFNPYSKKRKKVGELLGLNPEDSLRTINEYNEALKNMLNGKNFFSDSISDIYLTRAMKHTDLMYDHEYMHKMTKLFGDEIPESVEKMRDGHKSVINIGFLQKEVNEHAGNVVKQEKSKADEIFFKWEKKAKKVVRNKLGDVKINDDLIKRMADDDNLASNPIARFSRKILEEEKMYPPPTKWNNHIAEKVQQEAKQGMLKNMNLDEKALDEHIKPFINVDDLEIAKDLQKRFPNLQIRSMHGDMVKKANLARELQIKKDASKFLTLFDKFTHFWKLNVTTVNPGFHIRNKFSNVFQNHLAIGADAFDPELHKMAHRAITTKGNFGVQEDIFDVMGNRLRLKDEYEMAKSLGILDDNFFASELASTNGTKGLLNDVGVKPKFDPTDTENFLLYKKGKQVGNYAENTDRFVHYMSLRRNGKSAEDASRSVNKFLFDYSDLTAFEQEYVKRVIPFYTWMRKNIPLQTEQMFNQPWRYKKVSHIMNNINNSNNKEDRVNKAYTSEFINDYVQLPFNAKNDEGREEPVMANPNLPFNDLNNLPTSLRKIATMMNPLLKVPLEQVRNKDLFFDSPIAKEGENATVERVKHLLNQMSLPRYASGALTKEDDDKVPHHMNTLLGVKTNTYDYNKYKYYKLIELINKSKEEGKQN